VAKLKQMMPLSDQSSRSSIHIETNVKTTRIVPRKTSSKAETLNISWVALAPWCRRIYLFLEGFGEPSVCTFGCGLPGFVISYPRQVLLFYDFAPWRRRLIRDNQLAVGILVNVMFLGLTLCHHSQTKKKGETKCKIQSRRLPRVSDSLVYSSMVSFNV
jgi:hypothetical protein